MVAESSHSRGAGPGTPSASPTATRTEARCEGCGTAVVQLRGTRRRRWCSDRCRKRKLYSATCADCGVSCRTNDQRPVDGAEYRCNACANATRAVWTRESALEALHAWVDRHDGATPGAHEARMEPEPTLPYSATIAGLFGGHDAYLAAGGYDKHPRGPVPGFRRLTEAEREAIPARLAAGVSRVELARVFGVSLTTIHNWANRQPEGGESR